MRNQTFLSVIFIILITVFISGCSENSRYRRKVEKELSKGIRNDSLFLGLSLGMPMKEFYRHCWHLNKKGMVRNGSKNTSVEYQIKDLKYPATMNFYPTFYEDKIYKMPVLIAYAGWAPWNKKLWADSLQLDVLKLYKKWYGDDFMKIKNPEDPSKTAYVNIDANRQISIFRASDSEVGIIFTDLVVDQKLKSKE